MGRPTWLRRLRSSLAELAFRLAVWLDDTYSADR